MFQKKDKKIGDFFDYLKEKGLSQNSIENVILNWELTQALDFITESKELLPFSKKKSTSVFDFVANSSLSGGSHPCAGVKCRLSRVDQLARFAALYADTVLIQDPLPILVNHYNEGFGDANKYELIAGLHVLYQLKPLLEKGIVGFAATKFHFCKDCYQELVRDTHFEQAEANANAILERMYLRNVKFSLIERDNIPIPVIEVTGPDELVEHGRSYALPLYNKEFKEDLAKFSTSKLPFELTEKLLKKYGVLEGFISPFINDITVQNLYSELYDTQYVTDHEIDFEIITSINDAQTNTLSRALVEGFSHSIPFLADVELSKLLKNVFLKRN